jgi:ketosteroid isomerase-like protein
MREPNPPDDLTAFLTSFWSAFTKAEAPGDFSAVAHMCADDLVFQSPTEEPYETVTSLIEAWWTPLASYRIEFDSAEMTANGNLAIDRGSATDSFTTQEGETKGHRYN